MLAEAEVSAATPIYAAGEMADRVRAHDWARTPLGALRQWTQAHLIATNMILSCRFPALVFLGPELVVVYNDEYLAPMADKHPAALGSGAREVWPEAWHVIGPQLAQVMPGGASTLQENLLIPVLREGKFVDVWWTYSYSPIREADGTIAGVFVVVHDVTAELLATQERNRMAEQLQRVLEATTDGVTIIDREWRFTYRNPQAMRMTAPVADTLGKVAWEAFPGMVYEGSPFVEHYHAAMDEGRPGEFEAFYPEPLNIWVRVQVRPSPEGIVLFFRDVTEQRKTTEMLIKTEKLAAVGRLAASIAHEINNPLEAVTNLLYLARASETLGEVQGYLETAERELRRVSAIANQTLRFHKQSTRPQPVSCEELIDSALSIYQGRVVNAQVQVERRDRCQEKVTCFDGEIRQVLSNLVGNAIDAMPPAGGRLLLRSRTGWDWATGRRAVVITIADNGTGMDAATMERIFDPFFTTKGFGGTGLGLWVSQEIALRHRGRLRVRSRQGKRSGTVFSLFLPC